MAGVARILELMDSPAPLQRLSYADMDKLDPNQRWELIDGIAYAMSSPSLAHQEALGEFYVALRQHFKGGPCRVVLAPFDVKISDFDVVQPDLLVSCQNQLGMRYHRGAPDLVVEFLSEHSLRHDRVRKLNLYARAGVKEYWIVNPSPLMVEVLSNEGTGFMTRGAYSDEHVLQSFRFPELRINLAEIAAVLPPPEFPDGVGEPVPVYAIP